MQIEAIEWDDDNRKHAQVRATESEINQAIENLERVTRNKGGRAADYLIYGSTSGGRRLVIPVLYRPETSSVRPITCWEDGR